MRMARAGQIRDKVPDEELKRLLTQVSSAWIVSSQPESERDNAAMGMRRYADLRGPVAWNTLHAFKTLHDQLFATLRKSVPSSTPSGSTLPSQIYRSRWPMTDAASFRYRAGLQSKSARRRHVISWGRSGRRSWQGHRCGYHGRVHLHSALLLRLTFIWQRRFNVSATTRTRTSTIYRMRECYPNESACFASSPSCCTCSRPSCAQ